MTFPGKAMNWLESHSGLAGAWAALLLLAFYFGVITAANSFDHAVSQFSQDWPWILALSAGFGLQVRLHLLFRHLRTRAMTASGMAASTGMSGTAMIACCAHHVFDALPFLGLVGAAAFFFDYRSVFMLLGVLSNFVGIAYLLNRFEQAGLDSGLPRLIQGLFLKTESVKASAIGSAAVFLSYVLRVFVGR